MIGYLVVLLCTLSAASFSEGVTCYHCYDSFNKTVSLGSFNNADLGSLFVRCDKNKLKWNSWECPAKWPSCIIMSGKVQEHYEIVRSCGEKDFCSKYVPPLGVQMDSCRECKTNLCNDYQVLPDPFPPFEPGPLFTFNINVNLNVRKYRALGYQDSDESEESDD